MMLSPEQRDLMRGFGDRVDESTVALKTIPEKHWRYTVFDVPHRLTDILSALGFKPTRKNPRNWSRAFNPRADRSSAKHMLAQLRLAHLSGKWMQVDPPAPRSRTGKARQAPIPASRFGLPDFSKRNTTQGGWRMKRGRRP